MALRRIATTLLTVLLLGGGSWYLYQRYATAEVTPVEYQTQPVERTRIVSTVTASGTLSPVKTVQVGSQVSGRIVELLADFNSPVKKGDVIARIDPSLIKAEVTKTRASYKSAQAALLRAQADRDIAKLNYERAQKLADDRVAAAAEVDAALASYKVAKANVESPEDSVAVARAAIEQSDTNLLYTTILSPIDGVVISRDVSVGQTVAASLSAPTLFTIAEDLRAMEVHTSVAESDVGALRPDMRVRFTVDAYPNERFTGTVTQIRNAPQTVQNVVTYDAVVRVDNDELKLRPGMTASVTFIVEDRRDALAVPNAALRFVPSDPKLAAQVKSDGKPGGGRRGRPREADLAEGTDDTKARPGEAKASEGEAKREPEAKADAGKPEETKADAKAGEPGEARPDGETRGSGRKRGEWRQRMQKAATERTVWVLESGQPRALTVQIGISDSAMTEIAGGELTEGMQVIVGATGGEAPQKQGGTSSPLGGMGGMGGMGGGGMGGRGGGGGGRRGGF